MTVCSRPSTCLDVPHQGREGAGIGVPVRIAQGAEQFDALARLRSGRAGTARNPSSPSRAGSWRDCSSSLRTTEARDAGCDSAHPWITPSSTLKSNLPSCGFDLVPGNARQDGVEFGLDELGPYRLHVLEAGGAVVAQFSRQRQERLAVHDQLGGRPLLPQVRDVRSGGGWGRTALALTRSEGESAHESAAKQDSKFHDYLLIPHQPLNEKCWQAKPPAPQGWTHRLLQTLIGSGTA